MKTLYTVYTRRSLDKIGGDYLHPVTNKGRFTTPEQAETVAETVRNSGAWASVGKYYILTPEDWRSIPDDYKGREADGTKSAMIEGSALFFEGLHFEITKGGAHYDSRRH